MTKDVVLGDIQLFSLEMHPCDAPVGDAQTVEFIARNALKECDALINRFSLGSGHAGGCCRWHRLS